MVTLPGINFSESPNYGTYVSSERPNCKFYKAQREHTHFCNNSSFNLQKSSNFIICHQNICGLSHKIDEIMISLTCVKPHILYLTEHHLQSSEILNIHLENYSLVAHFCRHSLKQGGVSIFASNDLQIQDIDLQLYVKEKDLKICALNIQISLINLLVICLYRSPMGGFAYFLDQMELVLCKLYKVSTNIVICGDFNVNFIETTSRVYKLESLMASFSLFSTITFPTRNSDSSHTIIDNIFIDTNKFNFFVQPLINGLSDHDAQIIVLPDIRSVSTNQVPIYTRIVDSNSTQKFIELLSYENWESVFLDADVNLIFNNFQSIYLRIFHCSFPIRKKI